MRLWLLKKILGGATAEMRAYLLSTALEEIGAFPAHAIIAVDADGSIRVNGNQLDFEMAIALRDSARSALSSPARRLVREQVAFAAIAHGIHQGTTTEALVFSKAALWWGEREDEFYRILARE